VKLLVPGPRVLERVPVSLSLHKQTFDLVLALVPILPEPAHLVVLQRVAEVVEFQVRHRRMVTIRELNVRRLHRVVEEPVVACSSNFDTIADEVAVEFHQQAGQRQVVRWDAPLQALVVIVAERRVLRRLEESVEPVNRDHRLVLVTPVELLEYLCECRNGHLRVVDAMVHDLNQFLRVT